MIQPCRQVLPKNGFNKKKIDRTYQDIQRPLLREEGDGAPASSGTQ